MQFESGFAKIILQKSSPNYLIKTLIIIILLYLETPNTMYIITYNVLQLRVYNIQSINLAFLEKSRLVIY